MSLSRLQFRRQPLPVADLTHVLRHTRDVWEELRGATILLTGGTGFFGSWLLESFLAANSEFQLGATMIVLSRKPGAFLERSAYLDGRSGLEWIAGDVRDFVFPARRCTHIIHAATESVVHTPQQGAWPQRLSTIVDGTARVLEFARRVGDAKLLFVSSGAVYGAQPRTIERIGEDFGGAPDPLQVESAYGEGKRMAELLCASVSHPSGLQVKIARPFSFVGPHLPLDAHFAVGNFIADGLRGRRIAIRGDGTAIRSYLHAADLAIWLWTILCRGSNRRAYNVGSEHALSILEVAEAVAAEFGGEGPLILGAGGAGRSTERYVPDTARAANELGLVQRITLSEGIGRTVSWLRTCVAPHAQNLAVA